MRKHYTANQKAQIGLDILKEERPIAQIASGYGIHPNQLYKWKSQALEGLPGLFEDDHKTEKALKAAHECELQELYVEIGRLSTQLTWLKKKSGIDVIEK
jgi:putative transposase